MITTNGRAVVHGVKGSNLINTHRRHLQQTSNLIHDADARETVLSLTEIQQGHDGRLLVLWGVSAQDLFDELLIGGIEFEGDVGVVVGAVAVLLEVLLVGLLWSSAMGMVERVVVGHVVGTYDLEGVAADSGCRDECSARLLSEACSQHSATTSECHWREFRGHDCEYVCVCMIRS